MRKTGFIIMNLIVFFIFTLSLAFAENSQNSCLSCHNSMNPQIVKDWQASIHFNKANCADCHGGDPYKSDQMQAMDKKKGFIGKPNKVDIPRMCAKCHSDPLKMRPYNLPIGQYEQYKTSAHGKRLLINKDPKVAQCASCHEHHKILSKKDPQSPVFKPNIPQTCSRCHSNQNLMKNYNIPTNQYEKYQNSMHGNKVLKEKELSAPACADCHGVHGAAPPKVKEVVQVCGNCHSKDQEYFVQGRHGTSYQKIGEPKCISCHNHHDIKLPVTKMFIDKNEGVCLRCHSEDSYQFKLAQDFSKNLFGMEEKYAETSFKIEEVEKTRMEIIDLKADLEQAKTSMIEAWGIQHTLDQEKLKNKITEIDEMLNKVIVSADERLKEYAKRKKLLFIIAGFCIFSSLIIYMKVRLL
ncbi:MAG: cytochrome c3 family protein [Armatimonadetes bacterium]|nr:cytochrome c3 family protein [Armatimonadota bacterium]